VPVKNGTQVMGEEGTYLHMVVDPALKRYKYFI
jgi:hypothetical protein